MNETWRRLGYLVCLVAEVACIGLALAGATGWVVTLLAVTAIVSFGVADAMSHQAGHT